MSNKLIELEVLDYPSMHSKEVAALITKRPSFIERWALFSFVVILTGVCGITWLIEYPEIIRGKAKIIATNGPKEIIVKTSGRLTKLFARNGELLKTGAIIGYIESSTDYDQIIKLNNEIKETQLDIINDNTHKISNRFSNSFDKLGELQTKFQNFYYSYQQFLTYLQGGYYFKKKNSLTSDLTQLQNNITILKQQKDIIERDLLLSEETYKAQQLLLKDNIVSKQEDRDNLSKLLNKRINIPQINLSLLNGEAQIREKEKEVNELEHEISQQKNIFIQSLNSMQSHIEEWLKTYVLVTPVAGKISFLYPLQENRYIENGKSIAIITPLNTSYYAEILIPQYNFGKIEIGQSIQFRLDAYPFHEFGTVSGHLTYLSTFVTDSGLIGHAQLTNGLQTDKKKNILYRNGLNADAQIITKEMRLSERLIYNIRDGLRLNK